jgi:hypothetical protein
MTAPEEDFEVAYEVWELFTLLKTHGHRLGADTKALLARDFGVTKDEWFALDEGPLDKEIR